MHLFPTPDGTPFVRTDFTDDPAWSDLVEAIGKPSEDGFLASVQIVSRREFDGASAAELARLAANHSVLFVADRTTMTHVERPILCVDVSAPEETFRVVPSELWSAENNLSLANMDFEDFTEAAADDGIYRGF